MSVFEVLPPEGYILHGVTDVEQMIGKNDIGYALAELDAEYAPSDISAQIDAIGNTIVPNRGAPDIYDQYARRAVRQASLLVVQSFLDSNLPEPMATDTLGGFRVAALPVALHATNEKSRFEAFKRFGLTGLQQHLELRNLADSIQHYFDETTKDITIGRFARHGVGAAAHLLDIAWTSAYLAAIKQAQDAVAPDGIDATFEAVIAGTTDQDWYDFLSGDDETTQ